MKPKAIFATLSSPGIIERVYNSRTMASLESKLDFRHRFHTMDDLNRHAAEWKDVEYFFSTWGCPALTEEQIAGYFPNLKAVFYAAGSVQYFAHPFLRKGVRVFSANEANAAAVIDLTVAQIYLANKGYFQAVGIYRRSSRDEAKKYCSNFPGNEGIAAGIIGAGKIGGGVIERLKTSRLTVNVFDPFMDDRRAEKLKVRKCGTLEELFSSSFAITNHLADNEETKGILKYRHFSLMHDYGVFINTGRGAQVEEDGLVRALKEKPGRTALLDVTFPEPVEKGHPFYTMDNVFLSPHIAGVMSNETAWMGEYIAEEYDRFTDGESLRSEVTEDMLLTMA